MAKEQRKTNNIKQKVLDVLTGSSSPLKVGKWVNKEELNKQVNTKVKASPKTVNNAIVDLQKEGKVLFETNERGYRTWSKK